MNDKIKINLKMAGASYPLTINREDEEMVREAAKQVDIRLNAYREHYLNVSLERIIAMLKTVYDPEIPVNIYDLGLIYKIDLQDNGEVVLDMTLTAPNCPAADFIMEDVRQKVDSVEGVTSSVVNLVFEPEWDKDMMSEEAKLELGFL